MRLKTFCKNNNWESEDSLLNFLQSHNILNEAAKIIAKYSDLIYYTSETGNYQVKKPEEFLALLNSLKEEDSAKERSKKIYETEEKKRMRLEDIRYSLQSMDFWELQVLNKEVTNLLTGKFKTFSELDRPATPKVPVISTKKVEIQQTSVEVEVQQPVKRRRGRPSKAEVMARPQIQKVLVVPDIPKKYRGWIISIQDKEITASKKADIIKCTTKDNVLEKIDIAEDGEEISA